MLERFELVQRIANEKQRIYQKEAEIWRQLPKMTPRLKMARWMRHLADKLEPRQQAPCSERTI